MILIDGKEAYFLLRPNVEFALPFLSSLGMSLLAKKLNYCAILDRILLELTNIYRSLLNVEYTLFFADNMR